MACDCRRTAVAAAPSRPPSTHRATFVAAVVSQGVLSAGFSWLVAPATPMRPAVKALRAQRRREDTAQFNHQLGSAILHKSNCPWAVKRTSARRLNLICIVCCQSCVRGLYSLCDLYV